MLKYCKDKWFENKDKLEKAVRDECIGNLCYCGLVKMVVEYILNPSDTKENEDIFNHNQITEIDNGDSQGTMLYTIPRDTDYPSPEDYLITYVYYGSCPGSDTLEAIKVDDDIERQIKDIMKLCMDLVSNIVKPFNNGWRNDEKFLEIAKLEDIKE